MTCLSTTDAVALAMEQWEDCPLEVIDWCIVPLIPVEAKVIPKNDHIKYTFIKQTTDYSYEPRVSAVGNLVYIQLPDGSVHQLESIYMARGKHLALAEMVKLDESTYKVYETWQFRDDRLADRDMYATIRFS